MLWEGRPYLSLSVHYKITNERVRITEGIVGKDREDIELVRIQDIDMTQGMSERMMNIGDIHIRSHDRSNPEVVLNNVSSPSEVHEILRRAVLKARKKHNVTFREEM
ncbi:MAG: PH domain-containing protein [Anaerolineales bacterium]|nr:PH domain-containing protein [Anaerolineales bacterium]